MVDLKNGIGFAIIYKIKFYTCSNCYIISEENVTNRKEKKFNKPLLITCHLFYQKNKNNASYNNLRMAFKELFDICNRFTWKLTFE